MAYVSHVGVSRFAQSETTTSLFDFLFAGLGQRAQYRKTLNELSRLSDRELEDIGVMRGDISEIARRNVYGI